MREAGRWYRFDKEHGAYLSVKNVILERNRIQADDYCAPGVASEHVGESVPPPAQPPEPPSNDKKKTREKPSALDLLGLK
jgi:hypothetical protein